MVAGEDGVVDVRGEVVVVDEDADPSVGGRAMGEYVQSEVKCAILRDVVVRRHVRECDTGDSLAVAGLYHRTESTAVRAIRPVRRDVEVPLMRARRVCDVRRRRLVEQVPKCGTAGHGHTNVSEMGRNKRTPYLRCDAPVSDVDASEG